MFFDYAMIFIIKYSISYVVSLDKIRDMRYAIFILISLICFTGLTQNYFDLGNISYTNTPSNKFETSSGSTSVEEVALEFNFPIIINDKTTVLTGFYGNKTSLNLDANASATELIQLRFNIGLNKIFNETWSGTFMVLPKLVSDKVSFNKDNLQLGFLSLFTRKKRDNLKYKYGLYINTEEFGLLVVPILGLYYKSPNQKFETNLNLPIFADANYKIGNKSWVGIDFNGLGTSYNLTDQDYTTNGAYVFKESNELACYLRYQISKSLYLNAAVGYAINRNYEVYDSSDKINWALTAFNFGDDRTQLNEGFKDGPIFRLDLLYRIHFN